MLQTGSRASPSGQTRLRIQAWGLITAVGARDGAQREADRYPSQSQEREVLEKPLCFVLQESCAGFRQLPLTATARWVIGRVAKPCRPSPRPVRVDRNERPSASSWKGTGSSQTSIRSIAWVFQRESPSPASLPESDLTTWAIAVLTIFQLSDNCRCNADTLWLGWPENQADDPASPGEAVLTPTHFESPSR
jgi:hypothetical protein